MELRWLEYATPADLELLAEALETGRLTSLSSTASVQSLGLSNDAAMFLGSAQRGGLTQVLQVLLRQLARERRAAVERAARIAEVVWTGPPESTPLRDTRAVIEELFDRAERSVLLSTLLVGSGRSVFDRLFARMRTHPSLRVDLFVTLPRVGGSEQQDVQAYLDGFRKKHWLDEFPLPTIYYDPQRRSTEDGTGVLHAKCIVVDERWSLLSSANLTEAGRSKNIEAGVLLDHPALANDLLHRFSALVANGVFRRMKHTAKTP